MTMKSIPKGAKISASDKKKLEKHKQHHTPQHVKSMRMSILKGHSFDAAHKIALKSTKR